MSDSSLCPFSKPIIGRWCRCEHASLSERCSGKMACNRAGELRPRCQQLVDLLARSSRFVLGLDNEHQPLTHAQSMKIRCGGLRGMQRLLQPSASDIPCVIDIITEAEQRHGHLDGFPFSDILRDIRSFSHRRKNPRP